MSRYLWWIIAVAIGIRLVTFGWVVAFGAGEQILSYGDSRGYIELATNLASGNGFVATDEDTGLARLEVFRAPGLPFLLMPFTLLPHGLIWWGIVMSVLAGILIPLITHDLGRRIFRDERAGLIAAALAAFEPHMIWFSWAPFSEVPALLFAFGGLLVLLGRSKEPTTRAMLLGGVLLGFATLIRPPLMFIFLALMFAVAVWAVCHRNVRVINALGIAFACLVLVLTPWSIRNWSVTGQLAVSGMGWYNVYFDYLSSVVAIEKKTEFKVEKVAREASPPAGVPQTEVLNPAYSGLIRDAALRELWEHRDTVILLQSAALFSFFTNDSYYYYLRRYGFIEERSGVQGSRSVTFAVLTGGASGIQHLFLEAQRQYFIPIIGRIFTASILVLAIVGAFIWMRERLALLLALSIVVSALISTALGLGVEARLRVPIQPSLFLLAGAGIAGILAFYGKWRDTRIHAQT